MVLTPVQLANSAPRTTPCPVPALANCVRNRVPSASSISIPITRVVMPADQACCAARTAASWPHWGSDTAQVSGWPSVMTSRYLGPGSVTAVSRGTAAEMAAPVGVSPL